MACRKIMSMFAGIFFLLFAACGLPLFTGAAQGADIRPLDEKEPSILVEGAFEPGDSLKLKKLLKRMEGSRGKHGQVVFNSLGGNFMEGIFIGVEIFEHGWSTLVRSGDYCGSACAVAFLGGNFKIEGSGWLPDRNLEAGAILGFHSFFLPEDYEGSVAKSIDAGKEIANILYVYAQSLNIRPEVLVRLLSMGPDALLLANTPDILLDLDINVTGLGGKGTFSLGSLGAMNAARVLIDRTRHLLLTDADMNWRLNPAPKELSCAEFQREMLERMALSGSGGNAGPLIKLISSALGNETATARVYRDLAALGLAPRVVPEDKIIKVSGLNHANPFISRIAYFIARNEGTPRFGVDYMLCPPPQAGGVCDSGSLRRHGDIIYELAPFDEPLWNVDK